jgi:ATP-dependent RNA helicase DDX55/SPB4
LFRLPKMPELKQFKSAIEFEQVLDVDYDAISYKDKAREKKRLLALGDRPERPLAAQSSATETTTAAKPVTAAADSNHANKNRHASNKKAWSISKEQKEKRLERKDKRHKRKLAALLATLDLPSNNTNKKTKDDATWNADDQEILDDYRQLKKKK